MKSIGPSFSTNMSTEIFPKGVEETSTWFPTEMAPEELTGKGQKDGFNPIFISKLLSGRVAGPTDVHMIMMVEYDLQFRGVHYDKDLVLGYVTNSSGVNVPSRQQI
jgi:hypothetical protein